jgi:hypothetical protein
MVNEWRRGNKTIVASHTVSPVELLLAFLAASSTAFSAAAATFDTAALE